LPWRGYWYLPRRKKENMEDQIYRATTRLKLEVSEFRGGEGTKASCPTERHAVESHAMKGRVGERGISVSARERSLTSA